MKSLSILLRAVAAVIAVGASIGCQSTRNFLPFASSVNRTEPTALAAASSGPQPSASAALVESGAKGAVESVPLNGYYPEDYPSNSAAAEPSDAPTGLASSSGSSAPRSGSYSSGPSGGCSSGCCSR